MAAPQPTLKLTADGQRDRSHHKAPLLVVGSVLARVEPVSHRSGVPGTRLPRYAIWIASLVGASLLGWVVWATLL
jgi:hypothetical protein